MRQKKFLTQISKYLQPVLGSCDGFSFRVINVEFEKPFDIKSIKNILNKSSGCKVIDERKDGGYITPLEAENSYLTFISRIVRTVQTTKQLTCGSFLTIYLKGLH